MKTLNIFENEYFLDRSMYAFREIANFYEPYYYLYKLVSNYFGEKFSDYFIELVYVTLTAWKFKCNGPDFVDFNSFRKTILENKDIIDDICNNDISELKTNKKIFNLLEKLFFKLKLVIEDKPILIAFSETIHLFCPNLIVPIDRFYVYKYFYGHTAYPETFDGQWKRFVAIEERFCDYYNINNNKQALSKYVDTYTTIYNTKAMENMLIGYERLIVVLRNIKKYNYKIHGIDYKKLIGILGDFA